jgi:hypothetical protein
MRRPSRPCSWSAALVAALLGLRLTVTFAADPKPPARPASEDQVATSAGATVLHGHITNEAGTPLSDVRVFVAIPAADMRFIDENTSSRQREARSDARGDYRLELPGITKRTKVSIDAMKPGYRRLVGTLMAGGDVTNVDVTPGAVTEASLVLKAALHVSGVIVDEQGIPIPGVKVHSLASGGGASGSIEVTRSRLDGTFEIFSYPLVPPVFREQVTRGLVLFSHPDYLDHKVDDIYVLAPNEREALPIVLESGHAVAGTVLDVDGKPVPNALVKVVLNDRTQRKATLTDANGKFVLRGLGDGPTSLSARALGIKQKVELPMVLKRDQLDLEVRLKAIAWPADVKKHTVLGMQLADVTPALRSAYDLFFERGAVILDPGKDSDRLNLGELAEGHMFWQVGHTRVGSVREFVKQVLAETAGSDAREYSVRVVFAFSNVRGDGNNTQYLKLTKDDVRQLQTVLDQLSAESR